MPCSHHSQHTMLVGFDPIFPDDLARLHPMTCDEDTAFQESGHKYAIRIQNSWTTDNLISVTGWIKMYEPDDKKEFFKFAAMRAAKSINQKFMDALDKQGGKYPEELYDKIDKTDWEGAVRIHRRQTSVALEFGNHILTNPRFVRLPYNKDVDDELRNKYTQWRDAPEKSVDLFTAIFGEHEARVVAMPPYLTGNDMSDLNPRFGTRLHHDAEHHLNGHAPKYTQHHPEWRQFLEFVDYLHAQNQTPFRTEITMSIPSMLVCGQADFVARKEDGTYVLYDWKRTASIRQDGNDLYTKDAPDMLPPWSHRKATSRNTYGIQLNLYRQMLMTYGVDVTEMYLVCIHKDFARFQLIPVPIIKGGSNSPDAVALRQMVDDRKRVVSEAAARNMEE